MIANEPIILREGALVEDALMEIAIRMRTKNCSVVKIRVGYDSVLTCILERGSLKEVSEVDDD